MIRFQPLQFSSQPRMPVVQRFGNVQNKNDQNKNDAAFKAFWKALLQHQENTKESTLFENPTHEDTSQAYTIFFNNQKTELYLTYCNVGLVFHVNGDVLTEKRPEERHSPIKKNINNLGERQSLVAETLQNMSNLIQSSNKNREGDYNPVMEALNALHAAITQAKRHPDNGVA